VDKKDIEAFFFRNLDDYLAVEKKYKSDQYTVLDDVQGFGDVSDDDEDTDVVVEPLRRLTEKEIDPAKGGVRQQYIHFGIEKGLLGKSPGVVHYDKYVETLKLLYEVHGISATSEMMDMMYPHERAVQKVSFKMKYYVYIQEILASICWIKQQE
jgi:hypothetical protein